MLRIAVESDALDEARAVLGSADVLAHQGSLRPWLEWVATRLQALDPPSIRAAMDRFEQRSTREPRVIGPVGVIDLCGPIVYRPSWLSQLCGAVALADVALQLDAALRDPRVEAIVLRCDSPGGSVEMVPEVADLIWAVRRQKPVFAVADSLVASAAYWLASQATRIYATPSARLGSIGVYLEHLEYGGALARQGIGVTLISYGAHKTDGHPYGPLPAAVRARMQARVDELGAEFDAAVARGRGVSVATVRRSFGGGDVFRGHEAIRRGLADQAQTFDRVLGSFVAAPRRRPGGGAAAAATLAFLLASE